jgi:outer membrane protein assembly factor BamB
MGRSGGNLPGQRRFRAGLAAGLSRNAIQLRRRRPKIGTIDLPHRPPKVRVGTYDGSVQRIYVDGELAGESTVQQGDIFYPPSGEYIIGAYKDDDELHATQGEIEQVSVWNRTLSGEEIAARFANRKAAFPEIIAVRPEVTDWPTYNRDNQRTGISPDELQLPLSLAWEHRLRHPPAPAWPAPAKQDFWHYKYNLQPRVVYDRANHVVSVGQRVYLGSSADDAVRCLDANTGKLLWTFFTEGPVRLAPTVAGSRLLFGSDDGFVYCLDADDGQLLWKTGLKSEDRRIPGNRRIISTWPVRSSVLVEEGIAYFCAGMFPKQGVYQAAVDVETGNILAQGPIESSAQGYLERRSGRLFVPTGRDPAGAFVSQLQRRGKDIGQEVRQIPNSYPYAFIGAGKLRFGGGDGKVAAFELETGKKVWEAPVEGKAWSLAIAQGRLLVSTDAGRIYSFAPGEHQPVVQTEPEPRALVPPRGISIAAKSILENSGARKGFALVTPRQSSELILELARQSELHFLMLAEDSQSATDLRREIWSAGLSPRITVHEYFPSQPLPYTDYLFNLILAKKPESEGLSAEELRKVLRPHGGALVRGGEDQNPEIRGPLADVGEWTHMYANPANTVQR